MPRALPGEILSSLREPDTTSPTLFNSIQHFVEAWSLGQAFQFAREVLLQRLAPLLGAILKG
jgi:hypothetical protein